MANKDEQGLPGLNQATGGAEDLEWEERKKAEAIARRKSRLGEV